MILIAARGGSCYGIGNLTRACCLLSELVLLGYPVKAVFEADHPRITDNFKSIPNICFTYSNEETSACLSNIKAELLVCDLPFLTDAEAALFKTFPMIISLSDNDLAKLKPAIVISAAPFHVDAPADTALYNGLEYFTVKPELKARRPSEFKGINELKNVLAVFGGADPGSFYEQIVDKLTDSINFTFLLGSAVLGVRKNALLQKKEANLNIVADADLADLITQNDLCISLGGLTAFEALYLGKPSAAVEYKYLSGYVRELDSFGLVYNLGGIENFSSSLVHLAGNIERLNGIALNGYNKIDGLGSRRAAEIVIQSYGRFRG